MDKETFEYMKMYDRVASWALWDKENIANTTIIDNSLGKLKPHIVFVALNFAGDGKQDVMSMSWKDMDPQQPSWQNFHSSNKGSSDPRLTQALGNTRYEGAYMTDIIKNISTPDAAALLKKIRNQEVAMDQQIKIFTDELNALNEDSLELYFFGIDAYTVYKKYFEQDDYLKSLLSKKIAISKQIDHYSRSNTRFPQKIREQLDLTPIA